MFKVALKPSDRKWVPVRVHRGYAKATKHITEGKQGNARARVVTVNDEADYKHVAGNWMDGE